MTRPTDCEDCPRPAGRYNIMCLDCCARLVLSTRPDRAKAEAMLHVISIYRDRPAGARRTKRAPSRKRVLARVKKIIEEEA